MSGIATAIAGSAVVGAVVSNNASKRATKAASAASESELAFNQQRYDDWKEVYGPIQDNLSDYYSNLSPDLYEAQGLEAFNAEFQKAQDDVATSLAQRGITDSGLSAQLAQQGAVTAAENRAAIRMDAPAKVAELQSNFLQIGLGQDPSGDIAGTLARNTGTTQNIATQSQIAAGQATGNAITEVGNAAVALANYNPNGDM
ncbi:DNA ejection [Pseudoalteromonas phage PH1]|uniref:DNA ejection n=1 Tax=Pseudoalteromonas phage PH1 TaxID=1874540 RepID=UPI000819A059|nr:DNA ejection [Pseudoalteromonas phage PH1]ANY29561.1 hypothetical protein [Pseudoalteromonas phage PH1]